MSHETELPRIPETDGMLSVEDAIYLRKWAAGHGASCAAAARAKALEEAAGAVIAIANQDAGNPYKQALRMGAEAILKLKDKE